MTQVQNIKNSLFRGMIAGVTCLLMASPASALPPLEMLYCGNVVDNNGKPFRSGQFILRILEEGGTPLWTSSSVTPSFSSNGDFCITLGRDTELLTTSIFSGDESLFLEVSFKGDGYSGFETFSPWTPLVYAPFAVVAANSSSSDSNEDGSSDNDSIVEGTDGLEIPEGNLTISTGDLILTEGNIEVRSGIFSGGLTVDSGTLAIDSTNDRVGIGTSSPQTGLDIAKNVLITPSTTTGTGILVDASSVTSGVVLDIDAQNNLTSGGNALRIKYDSGKTGSSGKIFVIRDVKSGSDVFYVDGAGNVRASGVITLSQGSVSTTEIADSSVTTVKIVDATIATADLADSAVTTAKISDATIATADIADSAISSAKIASDAITSAKISDGTIVAGDLASDSVTTSKILDNTLTASDLAATLTFADGDLLDLSAINASSTSEGLKLPQATDVSAGTAEGQISWDTDNDILYVGSGSAVISFSSSIDSSDITDGTIVAADLADGAVTSAKILDGTIATADIASDAVTTAKIADGTIATADIADNAVTTAKISDATIAAADLASDAVTTAKILDATIAAADLASDSVTTAKILDATIANADISTTATIALSKLASGTSAQIIVGDATGVPTYVGMSGDATISNAGALSISSNVVNQDELAATITLADGDFLDLSSINASGTSEGLKLPQATDVSAGTAEGQISWDTDNDRLYIGTGSSVAGIVNTPFPAAIQSGLDGTDGSLVIYSEQGGTDYSITLNPHATMTQSVTYTLPANDGTAGDSLQSDGAGALSWATGQSGNQGYTYNPDVFPASPSALDDEFADGSLNAKWTVFQSTGLTATEATHMLKLTSTTHAGDRYQGYFQALPAGDFTIVAKIGLETTRTNFSHIGLALFEDATNNPNTSNLIVTLATQGSTAQYVQSVRYSQFDTWQSTPFFIQDTSTFIPSYFRIRRNGTSLYYDFSTDGITFLRIGTDVQWFDPAEVGIIINNGNTGATINGYFDFFRYKASDDSGPIGSW